MSSPLLPPLDAPAYKAELRREMKARRNALDERARARASWLVCGLLEDWLQDRPEASIAVFLARPFEISLDALARELIRQGRIVCAPCLDLEAKRMSFCRLYDLDSTAFGPWQVREPTTGEIVRPELVFAPGLAFAPCGHRLGTGGGWYDRVLSDATTRVGVGFASQIVNSLPTESHDIALHWIASDDGIIDCARA